MNECIVLIPEDACNAAEASASKSPVFEFVYVTVVVFCTDLFDMVLMPILFAGSLLNRIFTFSCAFWPVVIVIVVGFPELSGLPSEFLSRSPLLIVVKMFAASVSDGVGSVRRPLLMPIPSLSI